MRILIVSEVFPPGIGGIERMGELLATCLRDAGHHVYVYTGNDRSANVYFNFEVSSNAFTAIRWAKLADVIILNHLSLRQALVTAPWKHKWIAWLHTNLPQRGVSAGLKRRIVNGISTFAVSSSLAINSGLPPCNIINNCYDDKVFNPYGDTVRDINFLFAGRLIRGKGAHVFIDGANQIIKSRVSGTLMRFSIVGDGPESPILKDMVDVYGIAGQCEFHGSVPPARMAQIMKRSECFVMPSNWGESFGLTAIEAIACGCNIIATNDGGLPEAVGPCGVIVNKDKPEDIANAMFNFNVGMGTEFLGRAGPHLGRFTVDQFTKNWTRTINAHCQKI